MKHLFFLLFIGNFIMLTSCSFDESSENTSMESLSKSDLDAIKKFAVDYYSFNDAVNRIKIEQMQKIKRRIKQNDNLSIGYSDKEKAFMEMKVKELGISAQNMFINIGMNKAILSEVCDKDDYAVYAISGMLVISYAADNDLLDIEQDGLEITMEDIKRGADCLVQVLGFDLKAMGLYFTEGMVIEKKAFITLCEGVIKKVASRAALGGAGAALLVTEWIMCFTGFW